jgi:hypothetical protein
VVSKAYIPAGAVLATIPRSSLLSAANSEVGTALVRDKVLRRQMRTGNSWIPLLLALLAETGKKVGFKTLSVWYSIPDLSCQYIYFWPCV